MHATPAAPAVRLRVDRFRQCAQRAQLGTCQDIADHIGVSAPTVCRALNERIAPGGRFIAAVLTGFPGQRFEDVFEIIHVPADGHRRVA